MPELPSNYESQDIVLVAFDTSGEPKIIGTRGEGANRLMHDILHPGASAYDGDAPQLDLAEGGMQIFEGKISFESVQETDGKVTLFPHWEGRFRHVVPDDFKTFGWPEPAEGERQKAPSPLHELTFSVLEMSPNASNTLILGINPAKDPATGHAVEIGEMLGEAGLSLDEIQITPAPNTSGVYVWEGIIDVAPTNGGEGASQLWMTGQIRRATIADLEVSLGAKFKDMDPRPLAAELPQLSL